jgi:Domain of unknown function (DUF4365)
VEGHLMGKPKFNPVERLGINAVERIVSRDLNWIWREQPTLDFGIDGQIEIVSDDGEPTGQLIAVQVKSGESYFRDDGDSFAYYVEERHIKYWDQHCLSTILILHNPENQLTIWQWADFKTARKTDKGWCIDVPSQKLFSAASAGELTDQIWDDDEIGLRRRFAIDREFMERFESKDAFVIINKWLNKSLQYREIVIRFGDLHEPDDKYEIPIMATWNYEVADLMRHFLPWLDYDYYEEPDDGGTGEIEEHVLQVTLSKHAKMFLELDRFFATPITSELNETGDGEESRDSGSPFSYEE